MQINLEVNDLDSQFSDGVYLCLLSGLLEGYFVPLYDFHLTPQVNICFLIRVETSHWSRSAEILCSHWLRFHPITVSLWQSRSASGSLCSKYQHRYWDLLQTVCSVFVNI